MSEPEYEYTDSLDDIARQLDALEQQGHALDQEGEGEAPALGQDPDAPALVDHQDALDDAQFYVEMAEQAVTMIWPELEYDDKTRDRVARKLAPVLAKRNGELPPWLLAYKEELALAWTLSMVVGMSYRQIKEAKAQEDDDKPAGNPAQEDGLGHAQPESVLT